MIPARPTPLLQAYFRRHVRRRFSRAFERVQVRGLETIEHLLQADGSCLVVANHTSWWDGLLALLVTARLPRTAHGYALMESENLARLPFLGRVGGFGVRRGDAVDAVRALRYASRLLAVPRTMVWVFPQGRERPITERPLGFAGGAAVLARMASAPSVPAALRYELGATERPSCWLSFGAPLAPLADTEELCRRQEAAVEHELQVIDEAVRGLSGAAAFSTELHRPPSFLSRLAERLLARVTRY